MASSQARSFSQKLKSKRLIAEVITIVVLAIVSIFILPNILSEFRLNLLGRWLTFAIVAISIDLIWGYTGMLSLGHAVYFALGGYCLGMHLKLLSPSLTGASNPSGEPIPDFMAFGGLDGLPFWWEPFYSPWFAMAAVVFVPAIVAFILGYLIFRNRIKGVYFAIISQATALVFSVLLVGYLEYTAGTNGLTDFNTFLGADINTPEVREVLYIVTVVFLLVIYVFARWLTSGKFGRLLVAIRDDEFRVRYAGYHVAFYKLAVYMISAVIAAIGGALFVPQVLIINPNQAGIVQSIDFVIWVAVGGRGTLVGAVLGALLVNGMKTALSENLPEVWLLAQGLLLVLIVVFLPKGIAGVLGDWLRRLFFRAPAAKIASSSS
ncbi:urea ABC transporter permease subunit UrtC [Synechococcus sp. PCC 7336]|uniref:urea ABC transporter permease subunit UrtC n=1 Tax=Synechococcus sp. PCC 7336 TaxID=195250 RepID=UPI000346D47F|nr:urea ABC transporter permease subunit UrtC [Synechococcus sp. PCC 7336]